MKRALAYLLTLVLSLALLTGCGTTGSSSSDVEAPTDMSSAESETDTAGDTTTQKTTSSKKKTTDSRGCNGIPTSKTTTTTRTTQPTVTLPVTHSLGKVTLPLTGFCGMSADNKIIIQTDYVGYASGELTPPQAAYACRDGEMIQLKPFDITVAVDQEFCSLKRMATVPVRYFVMDSTVYAYATAWPNGTARFISIPNDSEHVLMTGGIVKRTVKVNVTTGACEWLTTAHPEYSAFDATVSEDGKYMAMVAGTAFEMENNYNGSQYVYNFRKHSLTPIPTPEYDKQKYSDSHSYFVPWCFVGDSLFFTGSFGNEQGYDQLVVWYEFNLSTGKVKERKDLSGYAELDADRRPYRYLLYRSPSDYTTADRLGVLNLKTAKAYTVNSRQGLYFGGANESGDTVMLYQRKEGEQTKIYSFIDMKTGKETPLSAITPDCVDGTYKGHPILGVRWCGERAVLINYTPEPEDPEQSRCRADVLFLPKK